MSPEQCETLFHKALSGASTLSVGKMLQVALAVGVNVSEIPDRERRPPIIHAISQKFNQRDIEGKRRSVVDIVAATLRYPLADDVRQELEEIRNLFPEHGTSSVEPQQGTSLETLPRKQALRDEIASLLTVAPAHPVSAILIDLDGFKAVNDTLGHDAGDECLNSFVRETQAVIDGKGTLYRAGEGDEFCVLLDNFSSLEATGTAERIRTTIEKANLGGDVSKVTCSIGVACSNADELGAPDPLIKAADKAMYTAKNSGKNRVCSYVSAADVEAAESQRKNAAQKQAFRARVMKFVARHEAEWSSERRLNPRTMDAARNILRDACSQLLDFYVEAQQLYDDEPLVPKLLQRAEQMTRTLIQVMPERERDVQNEGFRFWEQGNEITDLLKKTPL